MAESDLSRSDPLKGVRVEPGFVASSHPPKYYFRKLFRKIWREIVYNILMTLYISPFGALM